MFTKRKVRRYLAERRAAGTETAFDRLLADWLCGGLAAVLCESGMTVLELHIDWLKMYRCIEVVGRYEAYLIEIQIEPDSYAVAYDADEPDDAVTWPLESAEAFYAQIRRLLTQLD